MRRKWNRRWLRETAGFLIPWFILWYFVDEVAAMAVICAWVGYSLGCVATYSRSLADQEATMALVYGENWRHHATIGQLTELSRMN